MHELRGVDWMLPESHLNTTRVGKLTVVEPIPETIEAMLNEVFCSPKIKPRVDWHLSEHFVCVEASKGGEVIRNRP